MRALAIGAHPDDLVIHCGGTLVKLVQAGHDVTMCDLSRGDKGSFEHTAEEIAAIRGIESRRAAEVAGANYVALGLSDGEVYASDRRQRDAVVDLIRNTQPDLVITHHPADYMPDHNETSKLVFDASFVASLPLYATEEQVHSRVPALYYMETLAGAGFHPTEYVDVTDVMDTKVRMLEAHGSQLRWLREHDAVDIVDQMKVTAKFRGNQCGVAWAEAFSPCLAWLRPRPYRLLP